jgi:uncharacterized protein
MTGPTAAPSPRPPPARIAVLSTLEARVLGVLVEKERTVPDTYPLSLNALVAGCNQKNNRDPVLAASEGDVMAAVDVLKASSLVIESSGARVARYIHNLGRVLQVPEQAVVLLAALMLRGPQTAAELRLGTDRLYHFADVSSVEAFLDELAARGADRGGPLVRHLARGPGEREARWAQLLCGPVADPVPAAARALNIPGERQVGKEAGREAGREAERTELAALREEQTRMAVELSDLRRLVERLARELHIDP